MYDSLITIIDRSIITDKNKDFIEKILNYNPATFLNNSTKTNINKLLMGSNDPTYSDMIYITSLTSKLFIDKDIKEYINNYIEIYINTITEITGDNVNIFLNNNIIEEIKRSDNMFYYKVLLYINITYTKQVKKYKGK